MNTIRLTNSEMRTLIMSMRSLLNDFERLKPQGYQDALADVKALLARLETKLNANGG